MNGRIMKVLREAPSNFGGTYFVIKVKAEDGTYYEITPSSDCDTYDSWKRIAAEGLGKLYGGFQFMMKKGEKLYFHKRVLPFLIPEFDEEPPKTNQPTLV